MDRAEPGWSALKINARGDSFFTKFNFDRPLRNGIIGKGVMEGSVVVVVAIVLR